ncbi:MAG: deaminase [Crenarchaeota archaeon]|nr:deaminase [Thermoproteota archaeon]
MQKTCSRPYVIIFATQTIDGRISVKGERTLLSSERDLARMHFLRRSVDAIMVGANTVVVDNPVLMPRPLSGEDKLPIRVVVDGKLSIPVDANILDTMVSATIIFTSSRNKGMAKAREISARNVVLEYIDPIDDEDHIDLCRVLEVLKNKYRVSRLLVQGGGRLIGELVEKKLFDEMIISISPKIIGMNGVPIINKEMQGIIDLKLSSVQVDHVTGEVVLVYRAI